MVNEIYHFVDECVVAVGTFRGVITPRPVLKSNYFLPGALGARVANPTLLMPLRGSMCCQRLCMVEVARRGIEEQQSTQWRQSMLAEVEAASNLALWLKQQVRAC